MNWIKSNPFVSGLAGITLLLCGVLYFLASKWGGRYDDAKIGFDESFQAVNTSESVNPYPTDDNRDGKSKALSEYRDSIAGLSGLFEPYRKAKAEDITPQAFTERLKATNLEVTEALTAVKCELPENFYMGFEGYRTQPAQSGATGVLLQQMEGMKYALASLAAAQPSALIKVYREAAVEENGGTYQPGPNDVARFFPFEVSFRGSESSLREFLNALGSTKSNYFVVRCVKVQNERTTPPEVADAKFETAEAAPAEAAPANPFADAFFPLEEDKKEEAAPPAEGEKPKEADAPEAPEAPEVDTSRILAQVLGSEELVVFVRFDLAVFLPAKDLPKP